MSLRRKAPPVPVDPMITPTNGGFVTATGYGITADGIIGFAENVKGPATQAQAPPAAPAEPVPLAHKQAQKSTFDTIYKKMMAGEWTTPASVQTSCDQWSDDDDCGCQCGAMSQVRDSAVDTRANAPPSRLSRAGYCKASRPVHEPQIEYCQCDMGAGFGEETEYCQCDMHARDEDGIEYCRCDMNAPLQDGIEYCQCDMDARDEDGIEYCQCDMDARDEDGIEYCQCDMNAPLQDGIEYCQCDMNAPLQDETDYCRCDIHDDEAPGTELSAEKDHPVHDTGTLEGFLWANKDHPCMMDAAITFLDLLEHDAAHVNLLFAMVKLKSEFQKTLKIDADEKYTVARFRDWAHENPETIDKANLQNVFSLYMNGAPEVQDQERQRKIENAYEKLVEAKQGLMTKYSHADCSEWSHGQWKEFEGAYQRAINLANAVFKRQRGDGKVNLPVTRRVRNIKFFIERIRNLTRMHNKEKIKQFRDVIEKLLELEKEERKGLINRKKKEMRRAKKQTEKTQNAAAAPVP